MKLFIQASMNPMEFLFLSEEGALLSFLEWDRLEDWASAFQEKAGRGDALTEIFILRGPGSFTGLRKALIVANVLAHEYAIPLRAMTLFEWFKAMADLFPQDPLYVYAGGSHWHKEVLDPQRQDSDLVYAFGPDSMREALAQEKNLHDFPPLSEQWRPEYLHVFPEALDGPAEAFYLKAPHITL